MALTPATRWYSSTCATGNLAASLPAQRRPVSWCAIQIASYSLLLLMVAQGVRPKTGEFIHTFGDLHLYSNPLDQARRQLEREPKGLPRMVINRGVDDIHAFGFDDFDLNTTIRIHQTRRRSRAE
ncbi:MAG: hypothetical protein Ct9H300mP32_2420 [Verrucomicrobiota bacterium]|nr:MAG: hypothetical protein Ct9H300mP32_2420 [Verrucomicrobiota bacterium]